MDMKSFLVGALNARRTITKISQGHPTEPSNHLARTPDATIHDDIGPFETNATI